MIGLLALMSPSDIGVAMDSFIEYSSYKSNQAHILSQHCEVLLKADRKP
jgi:hypothetical protein